MGIPEQIARAEQQISALETRLTNLTELFVRDGNIDANEERALNAVRTQISTLRATVVELNAEQGVVDFSDEPLEISGNLKRFDDREFINLFSQSLKDWAQDSSIGLNSMRTYMISETEPAGLSISDVVSVVTLIFPPSAAVAAVIKLAPIVQRAFNSALSARSRAPSLNEIHAAWGEAITAFGNADHQEAFDAFVESYKSDNSIPRDVFETPADLFAPACRDFGKPATGNMPNGNQVQRAFLAKVLSQIDDSFDWDDNAGDAEIEILELAGHWSKPEGQLDDVSSQLVAAIKTVFRGAKVIELPVEINIIVRNIMGANMCEIQRTSFVPGNTGFRHVDGDRAIFDDFMAKRAYEIPRVSDLSVDS